MRSKEARQRGFTLIELMVVVAVAAVILGLAVPSFAEFIARSRVISATNDLMAFVNYGRSEAIKRGQRVVICKSDDGASCGGTWGDGAILFVDADSDSSADSGEAVLRKLEGISDRVTLSGPDTIVYLPMGDVLASGSFVINGGDDNEKKRRMCVGGTGRVESKQYTESCGS